VACGAEVLLLDVVDPLDAVPRGANFVLCDFRSAADLSAAFDGVSVVFHIASYGMSGAAQLRPQLIEEINVEGTKKVVQACLDQGVLRLVVTSSYNVVFCGQVI
jgi:nucleoside-diphosphate-sugar epimerase